MLTACWLEIWFLSISMSFGHSWKRTWVWGPGVLNLCYQIILINLFSLPLSPPPFILPTEELLVLASARAAFSLFSLKPNFGGVPPPQDAQVWLQCQLFTALVCEEAEEIRNSQMCGLCEGGRRGTGGEEAVGWRGFSVPEIWGLQVISHLYDCFSYPHAWGRVCHSLLAPLLLLCSALGCALLSFSILSVLASTGAVPGYWHRSPSQTVQVCRKVFLLTVCTTHTQWRWQVNEN